MNPNEKVENELNFLEGSIHFKLDEYKKAFKYLTEFADYKRIHEVSLDSRICLVLSNLYYDIGIINTSKNYLDTAFQNFDPNSSVDTKRHFYAQLAYSYDRLGDYKKAYKHLKTSKQLLNNMYYRDSRNTISRSYVEYENSLQK